jgi:DNA-binding CsgD family transcriptional regulator
MDLTAWVLHAADELAATGAKPRTRRLQATEPLTSQETRVALHAAKGMPNKEIAAALFLSPKTVEHHLSSVYRKRGFRSCAELAGSSVRAKKADPHGFRSDLADGCPLGFRFGRVSKGRSAATQRWCIRTRIH